MGRLAASGRASCLQVNPGTGTGQDRHGEKEEEREGA